MRRLGTVRSALARRARRTHVALTPAPRLKAGDHHNERPLLERILARNVIPFWVNRAVDSSGGYFENFDRSGDPVATDSRHVLTQSRSLWFFSRLLTTPFDHPGTERAAVHGFDYLQRAFWDSQRGGVFTARRSDTVEPIKHFYEQVMALDALIEYTTATGSDVAHSLVEDLIDVLSSRFRDPEGGYWEGLTADWQLPDASAGLLILNPTHKTISTHLNGLNVLATAHVRGFGDLRDQIEELLFLVDSRAVLDGSNLMGELFSRDWSTTIGSPTVSYGHDIERIWMGAHARTAIGAETGNYEAVLNEVVRWGWDRRRGGFYFGGSPRAPAVDMRKQWWVQCEALVASLLLFGASGSERHLRLFSNTLDWIHSAQVDWDEGEWFDTIDVLGRPVGAKGSKWKTGYHTTRSLLAALDLLAEVED